MEVRKTDSFADWIDHLRDLRARARIQVRLERLSLGNFGDVKSVGNGLSELRSWISDILQENTAEYDRVTDWR